MHGVDRIIGSLLTAYARDSGFDELPEHKQFERFANYCVVATRGTDETFDVEEITVDGSEFGIDGLAIQVNGRIVTDPEEIEGLAEQNKYLEANFIFVQAKTSESFTTAAVVLMGRAIKDFFSETSALTRSPFFDNARQVSDEIYQRARLFRSNPDVHAYLVTTGTWNEPRDIVASMDALRRELEATRNFGTVSFDAVDATRLNELHRRANERIETRFTFARKATMPSGIPGIESAYVGVVQGAQFLRLIEDEEQRIRTSLFEDNVRDFLGEDNTVNQNMGQTLDSAEYGRFPVLNNGVTVIAREVRAVGDDVIVSDYQIVNGCQTANVVHAHRERAAGEDLWIPLKVVATADENLITEIVTATNSQSAVKPEELGSRSRFERKLEQFFEASDQDGGRGLRYERRARQYAHDPLVPTARVVTRRVLVRSYVSFCLDQPHRATGYVPMLLRQMGSDHFVEGDRPEPYYAAAVANYRLDNMFASNRIDRRLKPARWHLLMAFRHLILEDEDLAQSGSRAVAKQSERIVKVLGNDTRTRQTFERAGQILDSALGTPVTRDVLRAERSTMELRDAVRAAVVRP
jgi:sporulation protein YlmC with PRC-barrel domain